MTFDMHDHLTRQHEWSERTFGPGPRTGGVIDHIRKELMEIEADPDDLYEWIDVVILSLDGAWRAGYSPKQIIDALVAKQARNEARQWPDWREQPTDRAIEHVRADQPSDDAESSYTCAECGLVAAWIDGGFWWGGPTDSMYPLCQGCRP